ncbi:MAG: FAD-binding oxidoreductase [Armatimonadota bacterium]
MVKHVRTVGDDVIPRFETAFIEKSMLSEDVMRLRLKVLEDFGFEPGMFVRLSTPDGLARSYSIANSSLSDCDSLEFHIRLIEGGKMSTYLATTDVPELHLQGPFGTCFYQSDMPERPVVFIGSGTGLAPLYAILTNALHKRHTGQLSLYFGGATADSLYFIEELEDLSSRYENVEVVFCTDSEDPSHRTETGSPLTIATNRHPSFSGYQVYTCGHPELVKAVKRKVFMAGANMSDIFADSFDNQSS